MFAKRTHKFKKTFDASDLPTSDLSGERIEQIEKIVAPKLRAAFDKLRQEKPHLVKSSKKQFWNE